MSGKPDETQSVPPARQPMITQQQFAEVIYRDLKESERATFELASHYGRWLIASLLLIHGGALVGAFSIFKESVGNMTLTHALGTAAWWLVAGLLLALACGFSTWLNWSFHAGDYGHMADPAMLWDESKWVRDPKHKAGIPLTYWGSIGFGIASALCVVGASWSLLSVAG